MMNKPVDAKYHDLLGMISTTFSQGQAKTISVINAGMVKNLFVQKYQLYLPNEEELRREVEITLAGQVQ